MSRVLSKLDPCKTLFLLCDVQEKFRKAIPLFSNMLQNTSKLLQAGKIFDVPLLVTEQYPKGLGNTVKELSISHALAVVPKTKFSMCIPEFFCYTKELIKEKPEDLVLFGLETHICVLQSSIDFLQHDYNVHIVADCCVSRLNQDRDIALALMRQIGCFIHTSESVILNLAQDKENPLFDDVKKTIREMSADMELSKVPSGKKRSKGLKDLKKKKPEKKAAKAQDKKSEEKAKTSADKSKTKKVDEKKKK